METQFIRLNMIPNGIMPTFNISQYDVGRTLGFYVYAGSRAVNLDNYTCTIEATRHDGVAIVAAVATSNNVGTFDVTATMSNKADRYVCQLIIRDSNSKRIASLPFIMNVIRAAMDENAEAIEEDASLYQQYTSAMQGIIAETKEDIVNEATARTQADNTLQSNINAEKSARQSADSSIQTIINTESLARKSADQTINARIDQIIAPSGGAPSAAEVTDARIGANGTTYASLGTAIRTQIKNLDDYGHYAVGKNNILNDITWTVGASIDANGNLSASDNFRYSSLIPVNADSYTYYENTVAEINTNTRFHGYDSQGNWVKQLAWYSNSGVLGISHITFDVSDVAQIRISTAIDARVKPIIFIEGIPIYEDIKRLDGYTPNIVESLAFNDVEGDAFGLNLVDYSNVVAKASAWVETKVFDGITFTAGKKYKIKILFDSTFNVSGYAKVKDSNNTEKYSSYSFNNKSDAYIEFKPNTTLENAYVTVSYNSAVPHRFMSYIFEVFESEQSKFNAMLSTQLSQMVIGASKLRGGSVLNPSNQYYVTAPVTFTKAKRIMVATDRPNSENCVYRYIYCTATAKHNDLAGTQDYDGYLETFDNTYVTSNNCVGVQFAIEEYDTTTNTAVTLTASDFADYPLTIYDISSVEVPSLIKGVPSYYDSYITERMETIRANDVLIGNDGVSFVFVTDLHENVGWNNQYYSPTIAKYIIENSSVDTLIFGGDYINQPETKALAISQLYSAICKCRVFDDAIFMRGNHETNPYGQEQLTGEEVYGIINKHIEKYIDTNQKNYYFFDNKSQKVRFIICDTAEDGDIDTEQLTWISTTASELASDWSIVILSHMAIGSNGKDNRTDIVEKPIVDKVRSALANISATVMCWICGHTHIDLTEQIDSFPIISVTCDAYGSQANTRSSDDRTRYTTNEQAFDVFHIDKANKTIHATRFGGGQYNVLETNDLTDNDRMWTYQ